MYKSSRDGFGEKLTEFASNSKVWVVSMDMEESLGLSGFKKIAPERFVECGISEQAAMTVAAGISMANSDNIVFIATFAEFMPMRCLDQIRVSVCMQNLNVKIISSHVGLSYGGDGESVQVLEDLGVMQSFPNMNIFSPSCFDEAQEITEKLVEITGPCYMRLNREPEELTIEDLKAHNDIYFESCNSKNNVLIISHGGATSECFKVVKKLQENHINSALYNCSQIKPLPGNDIIKIAKDYNYIFVIEEHNKVGGLGTTIASFLAENNLLHDKKFNIIAPDRFGESARTTKDLREKLNMTYEHFYRQILEFLQNE